MCFWTSGACCRLLVLCKICLPALLAVSFTLAGLAANDIAAALITGRTLYSGVFSLRNGLAALFTAVISSSLEIALLLRSRQALPLQSHTALTAALTCLMTVLFAFCGRLSPFLAPAISLPLSFGAVELAARELLSSQGRTRPSGKRPDILRSPSSPAAALALKDPVSDTVMAEAARQVYAARYTLPERYAHPRADGCGRLAAGSVIRPF